MAASDRFLLYGIQDWGQSEADRIKATQDLLDAAGFKAKATCGPVFGGIWPSPCKGDDGEAATAWLKQLTDSMKRGKYEMEVAHIEAALRDRAA